MRHSEQRDLEDSVKTVCLQEVDDFNEGDRRTGFQQPWLRRVQKPTSKLLTAVTEPERTGPRKTGPELETSHSLHLDKQTNFPLL